jgi:uncharacterized repeat protein (TIGR01451 family)
MKISTSLRVLFLCLLSLSLTTAHAQYVAIPDSNFGKWLNTHGYSACLTGNSVSGWQMDTTCSLVVSDTSLSINTILPNSDKIHDLSGVQYFKNLTRLVCTDNLITSLPPLPPNLQMLSCANNQLTSLPTLPSGLYILGCNGNQLNNLPALPISLTSLICSSNNLRSLPTLPSSLKTLNCSANPLHSFSVPSSVTDLRCTADSLTSLPALPNSLSILDCSSNLLNTLPGLPDSLTYLKCSYNNIVGTLPALPPKLHTLYCAQNNLTSLPNFPDSLISLDCRNNPLYCLPPFKLQNISLFLFSGTYITCLPKRFHATTLSSNPFTMPLCTPASGCDFYYNISGNVHEDSSANCQLDSLHPGKALSSVKVLMLQINKPVQQMYTSTSGNYTFLTDSIGDYIITLDTTATNLSITCPTSTSHFVQLSIADSTGILKDFGMTCFGGDYGVSNIATSFRPRSPHALFIRTDNRGRSRGISCPGTGYPSTITVNIEGPATYIRPAAGSIVPTSISGKTSIVYSGIDLDAINNYSLAVVLSVDTVAVLGESICITVIIGLPVPDANVSNDTLTTCYKVQNSYDPNLKEVYPLDTFRNGDWLTYTIHFQNTGNDTAYTVIVKDTLDANVDASSFQYLGSSHHAVVQLFGQAMVFTFPKINLVDSATDPPLSEGWIQYKVKAKSNLPLLTQVKNTAYIYFDNNTAIATNTTVNTVDTLSIIGPLGISHVKKGSALQLYPNPNTGTFTLTTSNSRSQDYTITNMLGEIIEQKAITADTQTIDLGYAAAGVYTLYVKGARPVRFTVVR